MVFSGVDQNFRKIWENNPSQLHEVIVNFLNEEKFEQLVNLCKDIFKGSASYHDKYLFAKKMIFDLINLDQSFWVVQMYIAYLEVFPGEVFIFEVIEEFMRYGNYEGVLNILYGFAEANPNGNMSLDTWQRFCKIILDIYYISKDSHKIYNLVKLLLALKYCKDLIHGLIYEAIDTNNYNFVLEMCLSFVEGKDTSFFLILVCLLNDNDHRKNLKDVCEAAVKLSPESSEVWTALGYTLMSMGNYDEAINTYHHALKLTPVERVQLKCKIWYYIIFTLISMGKVKKAVNILRINLKSHKKFAISYYMLGLIHYQKKNIEKALHYLNKTLALDHDYYYAWATLGRLHLKLHNFQKAFSACLACLSINNQYNEGISLYRSLFNNPGVDILSRALPKITEFGYRECLKQLDDTVFPPEFLKQHRYLCYSEDFQSFLKQKRGTRSENIIAIYGELPICRLCKSLLKLHSKSINLKSGLYIFQYQCKTCGAEEEKINYLKDEPYIKIIAIVHTKSKQRHANLRHEKFKITFFTRDEVQESLDTGNDSKLNSRMYHAVLLYGKEIRKEHIKKESRVIEKIKNSFERDHNFDQYFSDYSNPHRYSYEDLHREFLAKGVSIKKKHSNKERLLLRFFKAKTGIAPEQVVAIRKYFFFFVKKEDYYTANSRLKAIQRQLGSKARIIRAERSFVRLLFALFPDLFIHDILSSINSYTGQITMSIRFLFYKERGFAIGCHGEYTNVVNELINKYIVGANNITIRCDFTSL